ncbi:MAG TPA: hypothetical protein VFP65_05695, partial [Anaeromyxobacteraceae bacterium]|nr:hypothetical protein [Anaeromyxobacteraceae bacterium]
MNTPRHTLLRLAPLALAAAALACGGAAPARSSVSVTLASSVPSPQLAGTPAAFTASADGNGVQYQFWLQIGAGAAPALAQDWSSAPSFVLPPSLPAGDYVIIVHARDAAGDAPADASTDFVLLPAPSPAGPTPTPTPTPSPTPT